MKEIALKLPNAAETIAEIEAANAELLAVEAKAKDLAGRIGTGIETRFQGGGFNAALKKTYFTTGWGGNLNITDEGWRYLKGTDTIEPRRGAKGEQAREDLAAVQPPAVQPIHILEKTGLLASVMVPGRIIRTQWMIWDGSIYALMADDDTFNNGKVSGDWQVIKKSELVAADEQRLEAAEKEKATA